MAVFLGFFVGKLEGLEVGGRGGWFGVLAWP